MVKLKNILAIKLALPFSCNSLSIYSQRANTIADFTQYENTPHWKILCAV